MNIKRCTYRYAYNQDKKLIDIYSLTKEERDISIFVCLGCGKPMQAVLGKQRQYFRHIHIEDDATCNGETYLHLLAKYKIKELFDTRDNFEIGFCQTKRCTQYDNCPFQNEDSCQQKECYVVYDLKILYDTCELEKCIDGKCADILISSSKLPKRKPVLIEIFVSHVCDAEKLSTGLKIIEIPIRNERDVEHLLENLQHAEITDINKKRKNRSQVVLFNFKDICNGAERDFARDLKRFYVTKDGEIHYENNTANCLFWNKRIHPEAIAEYVCDIFSHMAIDCFINIFLYLNGIPCKKSCKDCRYFNNDKHFRCCNLHKKYSTPEHPQMGDANQCKYFMYESYLIKEVEDTIRKRDFKYQKL
ncbi:MAG: hypothetical protein MJ237_09245 [bacterium]|nr:hypothetical protein [bacterium]